jgi:GMP synthase-like glutamine amidotransferase
MTSFLSDVVRALPSSSASTSSPTGGLTEGPRPRRAPPPDSLRLCLVDMNDGHQNQAMRCLRGIASAFFERVRAQNPGVSTELVEVSPRDTQNEIPRDCDLYISSGGPGSPYDGDGEAWMHDFGRFSDDVVESAVRGGPRQKALFAICYSFEMVVRHFQVADVVPRDSRKFGVMPVYMTSEGQQHPLLSDFHDRLFAFEHRSWEAVNLDERRLRMLGGRLLARESRDGFSKGRAILALDVAPGVEAVQFHPEADRAGVMNWVARPEQAEAFKVAYGEVTYQAMLRTLDNPRRLARTYALVIPGWLARHFDPLAVARGWRPVGTPPEDVEAAFSAAPSLALPTTQGADEAPRSHVASRVA